MLAARLFGVMDLRCVDVPKPVIGENEILLKIKSAAVCGTDLRMYKNGYDGVDEAHPRTFGHEFSGIVEEVGGKAPFFQTGMSVALAPNIGCGICDRCVRGDFHLCDSYEAFGVTMDGAFAEYVKVPERAIRQGNLTVIPEGVSFDEVSINERCPARITAFYNAIFARAIMC